MKYILLLVLVSAGLAAECRAVDDGNKQAIRSPVASAPGSNDFVVLPNATNAIQFRLCTNASPEAAHLFNTFEIEGYGHPLLQCPGGENLKQWRATTPSSPSLHNLLVNGLGAELHVNNGMILLERASGPDWNYVAFDASQAYRGRLEQYCRSILFVAPDLFILHDHIVASLPVNLQMLLHPPAASEVDPIWHDVRLEMPTASLRINSPSRRELRVWERIATPSDSILPGTVTVRVGPTNKVTQVDLITVFAVQPSGKKMDYGFKLVESNTAVGARIHREGLPTLVAFRLEPTNSTSSLDGFKFAGPVGISVFRPKRNPH